MAHDLAEWPVRQHQDREEREGHTEDCHQDVAQSQVGNEQIGDGAHSRFRQHDVANYAIAQECDADDGDVEKMHGRLEVGTA